MKNIRIFYAKKLPFFGGKIFSVFNRRIFVMSFFGHSMITGRLFQAVPPMLTLDLGLRTIKLKKKKKRRLSFLFS